MTKINWLRTLAILYTHTKFEESPSRILACSAFTRKSLRTRRTRTRTRTRRTRTRNDRKSIVSRELRSGDTTKCGYYLCLRCVLSLCSCILNMERIGQVLAEIWPWTHFQCRPPSGHNYNYMATDRCHLLAIFYYKSIKYKENRLSFEVCRALTRYSSNFWF